MLESDGKPAKKSHRVRHVIIIVALLALLGVTGFIFITGFQSNCFGCGAFLPSVIVSVRSVTCTGSANLVCSAELQNSGAAVTQAINATLAFDGHTTVGTCTRATLPTGETENFQCSFQTGAGPPGSSFTYSVLLLNGAYLMFNGNFTA
jgi:hypothetical protein